MKDPQHPQSALDVITIGRASVDLYGTQVGGRLEQMGSFEMYIGGSPTNIATGTARLGLKSALITGVGDEHMGRFIREELTAEGVDTGGVITFSDRPTALVLLGIRDRDRFPHVFFRENCADMGLTEEHIDPAFIARARAICATGTHLSHPRVEAATRKALRLAGENGALRALDIDYRPNLWGLAGHGSGESRFIASDQVTAKLQSTLHLFDLIVGTEEEFHIAGGTTDTLAALRGVRALSDAVLVCKRGPIGAVVFTGAIPDRLEDGITGPGFAIEVYNVVGAGDGFMSGLLKGWLTGADWRTSLTWANACGALAVSRHGCTPAYPSWEELQFFLKRGVKQAALRHDAALEQVHWATNRRRDWPDLRALDFEQSTGFEALPGATPDKIATFKGLCLDAALRAGEGHSGTGILCDHQTGAETLYRAAGSGLWIARPATPTGPGPLRPAAELGPDLGGLREWPLEQVVKVSWRDHPDDSALGAQQAETLRRLFHAVRRYRLDFLLDLVPLAPAAGDNSATAIRRLHDIGVFPDWWAMSPQPSGEDWAQACSAILQRDPHCRGVLLRGTGTTVEAVAMDFALAARHPLVKGYVAGGAIHHRVAGHFMAGDIGKDAAVAEMAAEFTLLNDAWDRARGSGNDAIRPD
jgi:5-dehydro-2-deoxygluconokinase